MLVFSENILWVNIFAFSLPHCIIVSVFIVQKCFELYIVNVTISKERRKTKTYVANEPVSKIFWVVLTPILFFLTLDPEVEVSVGYLDLELLLDCVNLL